jgi:hypothetical protein
LGKIPGPWHTALTELVYLVKSAQGEKIRYMQKAHRNYGPLVRIGKYDPGLKGWVLVGNGIGNLSRFGKAPTWLALLIHKRCDKFMDHTSLLKQASMIYSRLKMNIIQSQ